MYSCQLSGWIALRTQRGVALLRRRVGKQRQRRTLVGESAITHDRAGNCSHREPMRMICVLGLVSPHPEHLPSLQSTPSSFYAPHRQGVESGLGRSPLGPALVWHEGRKEGATGDYQMLEGRPGSIAEMREFFR
jgi:hypothetical protein